MEGEAKIQHRKREDYSSFWSVLANVAKKCDQKAQIFKTGMDWCGSATKKNNGIVVVVVEFQKVSARKICEEMA